MDFVPEFLVFSGGGIRGSSFVGVFTVIEELQWRDHIRGVAGSSAGAIMGLALIAGISSQTMLKLICQHMENIRRTGIDMKLTNLVSKYGLADGFQIQEFIESILDEGEIKSTITFRELFHKTGIVFHVTGTRVGEQKSILFNHVDYPDMSVLLAVMISSRIPILFKPILFQGHLYVDGSVSKDFPMDIFPKDRQLGFFLRKKQFAKYQVNTLVDFCLALIRTVDRIYFESGIKTYEDHTIWIPCHIHIGIGKFHCSEKELFEIVGTGYISFMNWIRNRQSKRRQILLSPDISLNASNETVVESH